MIHVPGNRCIPRSSRSAIQQVITEIQDGSILSTVSDGPAVSTQQQLSCTIASSQLSFNTTLDLFDNNEYV